MCWTYVQASISATKMPSSSLLSFSPTTTKRLIIRSHPNDNDDAKPLVVSASLFEEVFMTDHSHRDDLAIVQLNLEKLITFQSMICRHLRNED